MKWAVVFTWERYALFRTKKDAQEFLSGWKKYQQEEGLKVMGSASDGVMLAGDGSVSTCAAYIRKLPKGVDVE